MTSVFVYLCIFHPLREVQESEASLRMLTKKNTLLFIFQNNGNKRAPLCASLISVPWKQSHERVSQLWTFTIVNVQK